MLGICSFQNTLIAKDAAYIWHPFTQAQTAEPAIAIARAEGAFLFDYEGRRYFDAISSWWVTLHGHCHPYITEKVARQLNHLEQVIFANFTHAPAVELAERLLKMSKIGEGKVFYSDNGSTAVETALKMALQYWYNRLPPTPKLTVVCFENDYHGDTFGAMSASGKTPFNRPFWPFLFKVETIPPPYKGKEELSIACFKKLVEKENVACFIFEPLIQGVAGMVQHSALGLDALLHICRDHQVIAIADEVMTGFGRTGPHLACDCLSLRPDIICFSKGISGGFLPLGATICRNFIYEGFLSEKKEQAFLHGHSYCANPLACAAALASLDLLETEECGIQRQAIEKSHQEFCLQWKDHPRLKRCESMGTILALEYDVQRNNSHSYFSNYRDILMRHFFQHDIFVRPFGNILHLMPPYCTPIDTLKHTYATIAATLEGNLCT